MVHDPAAYRNRGGRGRTPAHWRGRWPVAI